MKNLLIALVSVMATVAFANAPAEAPAAAAPEQKVEAPKDAAHGAPAAEHKEAKGDKKAKKNKKAKAEKVEKTEEAAAPKQ